MPLSKGLGLDRVYQPPNMMDMMKRLGDQLKKGMISELGRASS